MAAVWNFCKGKTICELDEQKDEAEGSQTAEILKKGQSGCGHQQPQIRNEGLKLFLHYKKLRGEEEEVCYRTMLSDIWHFHISA